MKKPPQVDALILVGLGLLEIQTRGTPEHMEVVKMKEKAVKQWRKQLYSQTPV